MELSRSEVIEPFTVIVSLTSLSQWQCSHLLFRVFLQSIPKNTLSFFFFRHTRNAYIFILILCACLTGHILKYNVFLFLSIKNWSFFPPSFYQSVWCHIYSNNCSLALCFEFRLIYLLMAFINIIVYVLEVLYSLEKKKKNLKSFI